MQSQWQTINENERVLVFNSSLRNLYAGCIFGPITLVYYRILHFREKLLLRTESLPFDELCMRKEKNIYSHGSLQDFSSRGRGMIKILFLIFCFSLIIFIPLFYIKYANKFSVYSKGQNSCLILSLISRGCKYTPSYPPLSLRTPVLTVGYSKWQSLRCNAES